MTDQTPSIRTVVGVMTGTSIDGIDAALVRIHGRGMAMKAELVGHLARPLGKIGTQLRAAAEQTPLTAQEFARLGWEFGELHAEVIAALMSTLPRGDLDLICVHGQTIFHQPPISWQLINPAPIARRLNCPVVFDLRQADLAACGQGAPITPIADWILFHDPHKRRAIVNLGGFCNVTILPRQHASTSDDSNEILGFDVCACNQILDCVARSALGTPFDHDGEAAIRGSAQPQAADALLQLLDQQRLNKRSLGTGDESLQWVRDGVAAKMSGDDLAATAVDAIARGISAAVGEHRPDEIIVAGGGARNLSLMHAIAKSSGKEVRSSADLGVPIEARESTAFAVLGALCADGVPITLPQVTGCPSPAPYSGTWCGLRGAFASR